MTNALVVLIGVLLVSVWLECRAQELEPRIYSPNPTGAHFAGVAYGHSTGNVLTDPTLPVTDISAHVNAAVLGYGYTFAVLKHSAITTAAAPYIWGNVSGNVGDVQREVTRSGLGDVRLRIGVNLIGGTAMTPKEFARRSPEATLGASLTVVAPSGQYDPTRLINIGANRWAFKPEIGVSFPSGRWYLEAYAGVWFFTDNDEYFGGRQREQDALKSFQTHIVYTFRPHLWLAFDTTLYDGGHTTVDGLRNADQQKNTRLGVTLSLPAAAHHAVKFTVSDGVSSRFGTDFTTFGVAWQYTWME